MSRLFFFQLVKSAQLCLVDLNARAHSGSDYAALNVLTLCCSGLCLDDSAEESVEVLLELFSTEGCLADGAVDDVGLVILHVRSVFLSSWQFVNNPSWFMLLTLSSLMPIFIAIRLVI